MTASIIPLPPVRDANPGPRTYLAARAACRPAAIPYSALANPPRFDKLFDPIAFEDALYEREIEAVREVLK